MSGVLRWEDPPPRRRSGGGGQGAKAAWRRVAEELRANPGRWALVRENASVGSLSVSAALINKGTRFGPGFEAVVRGMDSRIGSLYARYIGETPP